MSSGFADTKVAAPNLIQDAFEAFFWMNSFKKFNFQVSAKYWWTVLLQPLKRLFPIHIFTHISRFWLILIY